MTSQKELQSALGGRDEGAFVRAFEEAAEVVTPAWGISSLEHVLRYWKLGRGVADAVPGWSLHVRCWLIRLARGPGECRTRVRELAHGDEPALAEMATLALASAGVEALTDKVLRRLTCAYLSAPAGRFAYVDLVSTEQLQRGARLVLERSPFPILHPTALLELLPLAEPETRRLLALNYCGQDFRSRALAPLLQDLVGLREWLDIGGKEYALSAEGQIVVALALCHDFAREPRGAMPWIEKGMLLDLCSGATEDLASSREALAALPREATHRLLTPYLRERRGTLLLSAADPALLGEMLQQLGAGRLDAELASAALDGCGPLAVDVLLEHAPAAAPAVVVRIAAPVFARYADSSAVGRLIDWLGHSSSVARASARRALGSLMERPQARGLVEQSVTAHLPEAKRVMRGELERLTALIQLQKARVATPLDKVSAAADAIGSEPRQVFLALCADLQFAEHRWSAELRNPVRHHGALALHWLRDWFAEHVAAGQARLWCYVVEVLSDDADAVWVAVDSFARLPKLPTVLWARPRHALEAAGALLARPIAHALQFTTTDHAEPLYRLLARHARKDSQALLVRGLFDANKAIRTHCVDGLSRLRDVPVQDLERALLSGPPGTRIAAAELVAIWAKPESLELLLAALGTEKSDKVRPYLEDACVAAAGLAHFLGVEAQAETFVERVVQFLEVQPAPSRLPPFLVHESLPQLRTSTGEDLSERATAGLLGRVMLLDTTLKGRLLRGVRPAFDQHSLTCWSRHLHTVWARAKDSRHKWAVLQLWVFADRELIDEVGSAVGHLRPTEHTAVSAYLKVLQWHPDARATDWLFYWSEHLRSRGVREQARELLERVAYKRQSTLNDLRARSDVNIGEKQEGVDLARAADEPRSRARLKRYIERSWRHGYRFSIETLEAFAAAFDSALLGLLWATPDENVYRLSKSGWEPARPPLDVGLALVHPLLARAAAVQFLNEQGTTEAHGQAWLEQLERPVFFAGTELDLDLSTLDVDSERFDNWRRDEGWLHGEPLEQGVVHSNSLRVPAARLVAELTHTGYPIGAHDWQCDVQVLSLDFTDLDGNPLDFEDVDPLIYSEVCHSLSRLAGG